MQCIKVLLLLLLLLPAQAIGDRNPERQVISYEGPRMRFSFIHLWKKKVPERKVIFLSVCFLSSPKKSLASGIRTPPKNKKQPTGVRTKPNKKFKKNNPKAF